MLRNSLRWLLPVAVLILAYAGYAAIAASEPDNEQKAPVKPVPTVQTTVVTATDHKLLITSYGEVSPMESTQLSAQVAGEVVQWHPDFVAGGVVKRGEVLFSIEEDDYKAAVLLAEAELASAQSTLIEEKARAKVAERQAKSLPDRQVTDLYLRKPQLLSAQARVKSSQAALQRARRDLANCKVLAPYDALVVSREIGEGQYVSPGSRVALLHNIEKAEVHIPIAGFDRVFLPQQFQGVEALVTRQGVVNESREGQVVRDLGVVDSGTRMINLVVQLDDPYSLNSNQPALQFGSYVEVRFAGKALKNIYKLPQELVNNQTVWVVNDEELLEPRKVTVLRAEGKSVLVSEGLSDNEQLVLTVPEYPQKGMKVKVASAETAAVGDKAASSDQRADK